MGRAPGGWFFFHHHSRSRRHRSRRKTYGDRHISNSGIGPSPSSPGRFCFPAPNSSDTRMVFTEQISTARRALNRSRTPAILLGNLTGGGLLEENYNETRG